MQILTNGNVKYCTKLYKVLSIIISLRLVDVSDECYRGKTGKGLTLLQNFLTVAIIHHDDVKFRQSESRWRENQKSLMNISCI